jgi:hypothetical protein
MKHIQVIELGGRPVALALGEEAIIADHVAGEDRSIVAGMTLYALEVQAGARPGPYVDVDAERYARQAIALRQAQPRCVRRRSHRRHAARS